MKYLNIGFSYSVVFYPTSSLANQMSEL